jgi:DNA-binding NtrC family response regulator
LILVVDDEPSVVRAITATLATVGYRVIVAENGAAGLEAFLSHPDEIDLVLADVVMPIMDGVTMAQAIRRVRPEARVLLITAYSDAVVSTLNEANFPLIRKPFLPEDLVRAVSAILDPRAASA